MRRKRGEIGRGRNVGLTDIGAFELRLLLPALVNTYERILFGTTVIAPQCDHQSSCPNPGTCQRF
jgi:hypothetical protein